MFTKKKTEATKPVGPRTWAIKGTDAAGKKFVRKVEAPSRSRARQIFNEPGSIVTSIAEVKPLLQMEFGSTVKGDVLLQVTRQLAAFTAAGIPVMQALQMLGETTKSPAM
ncbi:MAG: hypothetical protein RLZZ603_1240, partial [Actinomycetota bacterium]